MGNNAPRLSARSRTILTMIAEGRTYDQILSANTDCTYRDIFQAAEEALRLDGSAPPKRVMGFDEVRTRYPRAYERWTEAEDKQLSDLLDMGETVARIAGNLGRNRGAIRSRILKLGLEGKLSEKERERFRRALENDRLAPQQEADEEAAIRKNLEGLGYGG